VNEIMITSTIILCLAIYCLAKKESVLKIIISIAFLNYPSIMMLANSGSESFAIFVLAVESCSLSIALLLARYVWRFLKAKKVEEIEK